MECQHNDQKGKFCGNCGSQLKKPCPECGEWEAIGRRTCLTRERERINVLASKKRKIEEEVERIGEKAKPFPTFEFLTAPLSLAIFVISLYYLYPFYKNHLISGLPALALVFGSATIFFVLLTVCIVQINKRAKERAVKNFFVNHSEYKIFLEENNQENLNY